MLANNTGAKVKELARAYPGLVGHLYSPGAQRGPLADFQYALDNDRYSAWSKGKEWDREKWLKLLNWAASKDQCPLWCVVPDVVTDRIGTLRDWEIYRSVVAGFGFRLAFAVQDGMSASDVPDDADVVFVGGSTEWKWSTMRGWCRDFPHVHVARVNTYKLLYRCYDAGAKSTDGTGFTRGCQRQWRGAKAFLSEISGETQRMISGRLFD